ncbi:TetR/AcrR family transcriptional regulator [Rathayibacter sp. VKM Ac-2856]|uniref:TetR/AcrR family transcriptional regulator n=1 Tax=unclassified Rathayibacter TaxID=2609250 RepID=UPI00156474AA|nr:MULTISPECIES: TetR/AcrR family transcriptional regulator [unclassified Rathayibacter]NQX04801.1 TetR/AcrR family transcriptional regulator [Rathayibacter sp. VKM Ac-2858]NQX19969.1 TetR/AcrR family transcriptional regulator [Rathayibacter sp. VKM Ac-2856]
MALPTSPPRRPRGQYAKTAARRAEIVAAGLEVFSASGYHAASLREIAEKVGLSQAGVLHHFANKWELLSAVLTLRDDHSIIRVPSGDEIPGIDTIRALIDLVAYNTEIPGLVELQCVLSAEATHADHPAHEYFAKRYRFVIDLFTGAFGDMLTRGQLVPGVDPRSAAIRTVATMDGLQVQWLLQRDALDMQTEFRRTVQTLTTVEV